MNADSSPSAAGDADAVKSAADWRVCHEAGLSAQQYAEFEAWLAASPRHAEAWRDVNAALFAFECVRAQGQADDFIAQLNTRRRQRRWRLLTGGVLAAAAAVAVLFFVNRPVDRAATAVVAGEAPVIIRAAQRVLEDGSRVELNDGAEIAVNYTTARREVSLLRGEAVFTVMKNPARPFVVVSGNVEVRAVGTVFAVQFGAKAVDVLVTEGRVVVAQPAPAPVAGEPVAATAEPVFVDAGGQLVLPAEAVNQESAQSRVLSPAEINRRLAWRQPRLQLAGTSLQDAVSLLNRENLMQVEIADPELGRLRLTGFFPLDNARGFVQVLEAHYGVKVTQRADGGFVLRSR